jgi:hypothetical protein
MSRVLAGACLAIAVALMQGSVAAPAQLPTPATDALLQGFQAPPASARPRVWWHWMNGNITKEGIRLDLDWMKRVGIGGVQNFDAALATPQVVEKRLAYMTPEWQDAFGYAVDKAQENGLELAIATSAGWSETGGPWVTPEQAMKKLVWSETELEGSRFTGKLPRPPGVAGPFQDAPLEATFDGPPRAVSEFYRDISVIAYEMPQIESSRVTARIGTQVIDGALLTDGALTKGVPITPGTDAASCIALEYPKAQRVASLRLAMPIGTDFFHSPLAVPVLESSADGSNFRKVADVPSGSLIQHSVSFPAVTARYFRVCFTPPPRAFTDLLDTAAPGVNMDGPLGPPSGGPAPAHVDVLELRLLPYAQIHRFEEKAGFAFVPDYYAIATPPGEAREATPRARVIDLTGQMSADGTLRWTVPKGRWRVLRFGYSLTGKTNHPATEEATGLEVDKLDRARVKAYLDTYLARYEKLLGPSRIGAQGLRALLVDSIEVGAQNWTESLPLEFARRRGYDLAPWMPALAGAIVGSAAESDRFLYDYRRTLAELIADSHYAQIADSARSRGLIQYGEALEQGRPVLGDDMEMRRHASIPMAAMWTFPQKGTAPPVRFADIRGAASVAHIYGQNLVAAESLTSAFAPWNFAPRDLRPMIDLEFVLGINRPVIHTSVHQPLTDKAPGLTLAIFGQYFNRNETWAEQAGAWVSYLSRTAYLLQQGRFAADVLYFYGEEAPLTALFGTQTAVDAPSGYGFDFANSDVLLNRLKVSGGALVTDTGMRYRLLWLGGSSARMTLPVLKRLAVLVSEGATVVGTRPVDSPSLTDDPAEFQNVAASVWSPANAESGRVLSGLDVNAALQRLQVAPDFEFQKPQPDSDVLFLHRHLDDGELYFLTNRKAREERIDAWFRVSGRQPEIWRADTGESRPASYRIEGERTRVPLQLAPNESYFVVFRRPASAPEVTIVEPALTPVMTLSEGWMLRFQPGRGAPAEPRAAEMGSWTQDSDAKVRYFSGTATYTRTLSLPAASLRQKGRLLLDLGDVRELAEVLVNGRSLGVLWHPPYQVDVSGALRAGENQLEVRVTNLWVNRLIGDAQPGASKVTFTVAPSYRADAPLRPSGLLGPVRLQRAVTAR